MNVSANLHVCLIYSTEGDKSDVSYATYATIFATIPHNIRYTVDVTLVFVRSPRYDT